MMRCRSARSRGILIISPRTEIIKPRIHSYVVCRVVIGHYFFWSYMYNDQVATEYTNSPL